MVFTIKVFIFKWTERRHYVHLQRVENAELSGFEILSARIIKS